jgi:hypothetical protein
MADLIAFRPRMGAARLKKIAQKMDYPNVSRFIEDAILEKVQREVHSKTNPDLQKLNDEIGKLIMKHLGVRWVTPGSKLDKELHKEAEDMRTGKVKSYRWKGSLKQLLDDAQHHRYAPPQEKQPKQK